MTRHNQQLGRGVNNIQFAQNARSVRRKDHLLQMVDDDFVAAVGTQRCLDSLGDGLAGLDIADNSTIFGIMTVLFSIISFSDIH